MTILANAISTPVLSPPFLYRLPFDEEITTGFVLPGVMTAGACPNASRGPAAAASPAAVPVITNSRRFTFRGMVFLSVC